MTTSSSAAATTGAQVGASGSGAESESVGVNGDAQSDCDLRKLDENIPKTNLGEVVDGIRYLARPLWGTASSSSPSSRAGAWGWTVLLVGLSVAMTGYAVTLSMMQRRFWNLLASRSQAQFSRLLVVYFVVVLIGPFVSAAYSWVKNRVALKWRGALNQWFQQLYFSRLNYYRLSTQTIDNPDQRLSENIEMVTTQAVKLVTRFLDAFLDLSIFSAILYFVYAPLFYLLVVYSVVGSLVIVARGRNLLRLNRRQVRLESDFRFALVRVRENAENIAFYQGEDTERTQIKRRFANLATNALGLFNLQRDVDYLATAFRFLAQVLPSIVMAPRYFAGAIQLGVISQAYVSYNKVLTSMGAFAQEFQVIAQFSAGVRRLMDFSAVLEETHESFENDNNTSNPNDRLQTPTQPTQRLAYYEQNGSGENNSTGTSRRSTNADSQSSSSSPLSVQVRNVVVKIPATGQVLVRDVSFELSGSERLLIVGSSGIGKSSLLRVLCGLWPATTSIHTDDDNNKKKCVVITPAKEESLFLSQRPFLMLGSLRDNMAYPRTAAQAGLDDAALADVLAQVNLAHLQSRLDDAGESLAKTLSLGEQQRLAFARVLTNRPRFVVLDEATSALDQPNEAAMYRLVAQRGIMAISVGNRPSLLAWHERVLRVKADRQWDIVSAQKAREDLKRQNEMEV